ncbi:MAG: WecB/TagA/CpsF family glycosyltransferase [Pseudomonadota bacterium]
MSALHAARVNLCGYNVLITSPEDVKKIITNRIQNREGARVLTLNLEHISRSQSDKDFHHLTTSADLICADGMPIVWAGNALTSRHNKIVRCTGVDLVADMITDESTTTYGIIGGVDPQKALHKLKANPKRLKYLNNGIIDADEDSIEELIDDLKITNPDVVFIALGVNKADCIAHHIACVMPHIIIVCVGGSFEFLAGLTNRAPKWMQVSGLEWLHRLCSEPKRLAKRYILQYPRGGLALIKFVVTHMLLKFCSDVN